jgi:hypothetical protein
MGPTRPCAWRTVQTPATKGNGGTDPTITWDDLDPAPAVPAPRSRSGARDLGQAGSASTARSRRGDTPSLAATSVRGRSGSASMIWRARRRVTVVGRRPESPSGLPIRGTEPTEVPRRSAPTERARDRSGPTGRTTALAAGRSIPDARRPGGTSSSCGTWTGSGTSAAGGTSSRGGTCVAGGIPLRSGTWLPRGVCGAAGTSSRNGTCASASCTEVGACWAGGTRHGRGTWAPAGT